MSGIIGGGAQPVLAVDPNGRVTIVKPEVVTEREKQEALAKQRMHRQVALEMYASENKSDFTISEKKALLDECVDLAGYLIEKTGGHQ